MTSPPIRAITFDIGGTLLVPHPSVGEIYARKARLHGVEGEAGLLEERFFRAFSQQEKATAGKSVNEGSERAKWRAVVITSVNILLYFCALRRWQRRDFIVDAA